MMNLDFYVATEEDISFINNIYNDNIESLHGTYRNIDIWYELLRKQGHTYYIVKSNSPVAWFRIDIENEELWIGMIQVDPKYHHQGIGKFILAITEEMARSKGFKKVGIHTTEDNLIARSLYTSAGYVVREIGPCTTADGAKRVGYSFIKQI